MDSFEALEARLTNAINKLHQRVDALEKLGRDKNEKQPMYVNVYTRINSAYVNIGTASRSSFGDVKEHKGYVAPESGIDAAVSWFLPAGTTIFAAMWEQPDRSPRGILGFIERDLLVPGS